MTRVALLVNIPTPYRMQLYKGIAQQEDLEFRAFFNAPKEKNRDWDVELNDQPWARLLPHKTVNLGRKDLVAIHYNPTLLTEIEQWQPDVVVLGGYNSFSHIQLYLWCISKGIPYVLWNGSTLSEGGVLRWLALPIIRRMVRDASSYIVYGSLAREYLKALGARDTLIYTAYNTVDTDFFASEAARLQSEVRLLRNSHAIPENKRVLLFVGQLIERKGVTDLFRAVQLHNLVADEDSKLHLVVAGTGKLERHLRTGFSADDVPTTWLGYVQTPQMPTVFALADAVILPSREEIWGLTLNEAMASKKLAIGSNACGATFDLIRNRQTGLAFEAGNIEDLQGVLQYFSNLTEPELLEIANRGQERVMEKFSMRQYIERFSEAIRAVSPLTPKPMEKPLTSAKP